MSLRTRLESGTTPETQTCKDVPEALITEGSECSGKLRFSGDVCIEGRIEGEIECQKTILIGPTGSVQASVLAESVCIAGEVVGDIVARCEITLHKSARVRGDMQTAGIVIEPGALVAGRIAIGSEAAGGSEGSSEASVEPLPGADVAA